MKFFLPLIALLLISCTLESQEEIAGASEIDVNQEKNIAVSEEVLDTIVVDSAYQFSIGSYNFLIEDLDSAVKKVDRLPYLWSGDSTEIIELKKDNFVSRDSLGLLFKSVSKDSSLHLIDDMSDAYSEYIHYYFEGNASHEDFWKVYTSLYEASMMLLINKNDLDSTFLIGQEYSNPTKDLIISANCDLEAGFDYNGFQLLENKKGKLIDIGLREFGEFGFDKIQWISDTSFLARKIALREEDDFNYNLSWVKITISKN